MVSRVRRSPPRSLPLPPAPSQPSPPVAAVSASNRAVAIAALALTVLAIDDLIFQVSMFIVARRVRRSVALHDQIGWLPFERARDRCHASPRRRETGLRSLPMCASHPSCLDARTYHLPPIPCRLQPVVHDRDGAAGGAEDAQVCTTLVRFGRAALARARPRVTIERLLATISSTQACRRRCPPRRRFYIATSIGARRRGWERRGPGLECLGGAWHASGASGGCSGALGRPPTRPRIAQKSGRVGIVFAAVWMAPAGKGMHHRILHNQ